MQKTTNGILFPKLFWPTVRKKCSGDLKFEAEGREFAKVFRSLEKFIRTVKSQYNFWNRILFQLVSGGLSDRIHYKKYNSNWKKKYLGFKNLQEKLENLLIPWPKTPTLKKKVLDSCNKTIKMKVWIVLILSMLTRTGDCVWRPWRRDRRKLQ